MRKILLCWKRWGQQVQADVYSGGKLVSQAAIKDSLTEASSYVILQSLQLGG